MRNKKHKLQWNINCSGYKRRWSSKLSSQSRVLSCSGSIMASNSIIMMLAIIFFSGASATSPDDEIESYLEQQSQPEQELFEQQLPSEPPRNCINKPKHVVFDHSLNIDTEMADYPFDNSKEFVPGSKEDQEASQWYVVTRDGYEYEGSPEVLGSIFDRARLNSIVKSYIQSLDSAARMTDETQRYKRSVFPPDTRTRVRNLDRFPYTAMGRVSLGCTGTFIGPRHILTAGHCVYDHRRRQWHDQLDFHQEKNCNPDQGTVYRWTRALTVRGWMRDGKRVYDYGMIVVRGESDVVMEYGYHRNTSPFIINIAGYPGDKRGQCMWRTHCNVTRWFMEELEYECDTAGGMSGSAVYAYWSSTNRRLITCVHAYGRTRRNSCTRLTEPRVEELRQWIEDN